jgi:hypothetical protein
MIKKAILAAAILLAIATPSLAQVSSGRVSTNAPTYATGTAQPLSLDTAGGLRVTCPDGTCSGGGGGGGNVNVDEIGGNPVTVTTPGVLDVNVVNSAGNTVDITDIGGNAVTVTVPGSLDVTCVSGCVAGSGVSQGTATTAAPTYVNGTNNPLSLALNGDLRTVFSNTAIGISGSLPAGTNNIGDVDVLTLPSIPAGANNIGSVNAVQSGTWNVNAVQSGTWTVQPGNTANTTPWLVTAVPPTTQADTLMHSAVLANSTNATNVKNGAGTLFNVSVANNSGTVAYLKLYNSASAPTCGSGTPVARYIIPASTAGAGSNIDIAVGAEYTSGIGYCVTTGIADADTAAVAANAYIVNIVYK